MHLLTGPGLGGVIADAHLDSRDRMGRLLSFVARTVQDGWVGAAAARGLGTWKPPCWSRGARPRGWASARSIS